MAPAGSAAAEHAPTEAPAFAVAPVRAAAGSASPFPVVIVVATVVAAFVFV